MCLLILGCSKRRTTRVELISAVCWCSHITLVDPADFQNQVGSVTIEMEPRMSYFDKLLMRQFRRRWEKRIEKCQNCSDWDRPTEPLPITENENFQDEARNGIVDFKCFVTWLVNYHLFLVETADEIENIDVAMDVAIDDGSAPFKNQPVTSKTN